MTYYRAPHKPFLLLSTMDLIAQGHITQNLIEPSYELVDTFNTYRVAIMPPGSTTSMAYPFSRLKTDVGARRVHLSISNRLSHQHQFATLQETGSRNPAIWP
jgi:predicted restriction endonuclease